MSNTTENLGLFKYDPIADKDQKFDIDQALNQNWDKVDVLKELVDAAQSTADSKSDFSGSYNDLSDKPTIPSKASDVGADASGTAASVVSAHNSSSSAHSDIRALISAAQSAASGGAKIQTFSYTGNGKWGESNPNSVTFSFTPKIVALIASVRISDGVITRYVPGSCYWITLMDVVPTTYSNNVGLGYHYDGMSSYPTYFGKKSTDGKTLYWYSHYAIDTSNDASVLQFNATGNTYHGIAIG